MNSTLPEPELPEVPETVAIDYSVTIVRRDEHGRIVGIIKIDADNTVTEETHGDH